MNNNEKNMYIKPSKGVQVRDPQRGYAFVPAAGSWVPRDSYWLRRVSDGAVQITEPPKTAPAKAADTNANK